MKDLVGYSYHHGDVGSDEVEVENLRDKSSSVLPLTPLNSEQPFAYDDEEDFVYSCHLRKHCYLLSYCYLLDQGLIHHDDAGSIEHIGDDHVHFVILVFVIVERVILFICGLLEVLEVGGSQEVEGVFLNLVPSIPERFHIVSNQSPGFYDPLIAVVGYNEDNKAD